MHWKYLLLLTYWCWLLPHYSFGGNVSKLQPQPPIDVKVVLQSTVCLHAFTNIIISSILSVSLTSAVSPCSLCHIENVPPNPSQNLKKNSPKFENFQNLYDLYKLCCECTYTTFGVISQSLSCLVSEKKIFKDFHQNTTNFSVKI